MVVPGGGDRFAGTQHRDDAVAGARPGANVERRGGCRCAGDGAAAFGRTWVAGLRIRGLRVAGLRLGGLRLGGLRFFRVGLHRIGLGGRRCLGGRIEGQIGGEDISVASVVGDRYPAADLRPSDVDGLTLREGAENAGQCGHAGPHVHLGRGCGGATGGGLDAGQAGVLGVDPGALAVIGDRGPFALRIAAALDLLARGERAEDLGADSGFDTHIDRGGRGDRVVGRDRELRDDESSAYECPGDRDTRDRRSCSLASCHRAWVPSTRRSCDGRGRIGVFPGHTQRVTTPSPGQRGDRRWSRRHAARVLRLR
ncbi:hypothetical protein SDC9_138093 [bioreactor metagenome]|uniref:Uncharacterized protein n=1 Tax=bioreactor metagenome TaxID=1076179 RepID=A0A645DNV4_9ZZZZ